MIGNFARLKASSETFQNAQRKVQRGYYHSKEIDFFHPRL